MEALRYVGVAGLIGLLVRTVPMFLGIAFAVRPSERWLALMRPVTLAGIFAAIANLFLGITNALMYASRATPGEPLAPRLAAGLGETWVQPFVGFVCLTIAWLCVAIGMRKQS
jgi:hypothetical protein